MIYKKIMVATDGSELAQKAVSKGLALAKKLDASLVAVTVTVPWSSIVSGEMAIAFSREEYLKGAEQQADQLLGKVANEAKESGLSCERVHVPEKFVSDGLLDTAKERGCDLMVMASHGRRGFSRFFLGSQTDQVLVQTDIDVLVVR